MDKTEATTNLQIVASILEIEGENPYKVRAYQQAAQSIAESVHSLSDILSRSVTVPGVGPDTRTLLQSLLSRGLEGALAELKTSTPPSAVGLLRVPGIGPKTAYTLVHQHGIRSIQELSHALQTGTLTGKPGFGLRKVHRMKRDIAVLMRRFESIPIAIARPLGIALEQELAGLEGVEQMSLTGPLRRGHVTVRRVELVVGCIDRTSLIQWCNAREAIETDGEWDVTVSFGSERFPAHLFVVPNEQFAQKLLQTTGDDVHNTVLLGLLEGQGYTWKDDGLRDADGAAVHTPSERSIYALAGLPDLPPEIREGRGMLLQPASLVKRTDIRGDLHVHSAWSDGSLSIEEIVQEAERLGYEYIAITDHSQHLTIANGLTPERLRQRKDEMDAIQRKTHVHILNGIEVDILPDGQLDLPDDVLFELDIVVASVHSAMHQSENDMTERILKAIRHPAVDIIGHLTGRIIGRRSGYEVDISRILDAAAVYSVGMELNANPNRLDIEADTLRRATERGVWTAINTDTHHVREFENIDYGIRMARRGWIEKGRVLNTLPYDALVKRLHQKRHNRR